MAELKVLYPAPVNNHLVNRDLEWTVHHELSYYSVCPDEQMFLIDTELEGHVEVNKSALRAAPFLNHQWEAEEEVLVCHDMEIKPQSKCMEDVHGCLQAPETNYDHTSDLPKDLSMLSDNNPTPDPEKSVDYGFISAVTFLLTGITLVVISYTIPQDIKVNPDSVSAREMERLMRENARVSAHLDRCVIAGLCLLTLGGVLLSTLLMISLYKGEMDRRRAFACSKHSTKFYGSVNFNHGVPSHLSVDEDDTFTEVSS
ncbi:transmembrane protein 74 [Trichomycterus rosablanca]|uniref:transmembrane protein 74 n=1 Tax=Trichomycterus rosablanca TaxID=2290929 RepID=UPI002F3582AB